MTSAICWPENIIPLVQPAYSPEINGTRPKGARYGSGIAPESRFGLQIQRYVPRGEESDPREIEQFWQWLKQPLKNQIFPSLQALWERVQELFDQLTLEHVMSVASYNFILEALLYAASH